MHTHRLQTWKSKGRRGGFGSVFVLVVLERLYLNAKGNSNKDDENNGHLIMV